MGEKNLHELPDMSTLADSDYVILTSADNGKVLKVVDGKWTAVNA